MLRETFPLADSCVQLCPDVCLVEFWLSTQQDWVLPRGWQAPLPQPELCPFPMHILPFILVCCHFTTKVAWGKEELWMV